MVSHTLKYVVCAADKKTLSSRVSIGIKYNLNRIEMLTRHLVKVLFFGTGQELKVKNLKGRTSDNSKINHYKKKK